MPQENAASLHSFRLFLPTGQYTAKAVHRTVVLSTTHRFAAYMRQACRRKRPIAKACLTRCRGNGILKGGVGDGTYSFNAGDDQDVINTSGEGGSDELHLGEGLMPDDVDGVLKRKTTTGLQGSDSLIITFRDSSDSITLDNYFGSTNYRVEHITFADGTDWVTEDLLSYFEDEISLPVAAPVDAPVSLSLMHQQIAQFMAGDGEEEDDAVVVPALSTSHTTVASLVNY